MAGADRGHTTEVDCVTLNVTLNQAWATGNTKICVHYPKILTGRVHGRTLDVEGKQGPTHSPNPPTTTISSCSGPPPPPYTSHTFPPAQDASALFTLTSVLAVPSTLIVLFLKEGAWFPMFLV